MSINTGLCWISAAMSAPAEPAETRVAFLIHLLKSPLMSLEGRITPVPSRFVGSCAWKCSGRLALYVLHTAAGPADHLYGPQRRRWQQNRRWRKVFEYSFLISPRNDNFPPNASAIYFVRMYAGGGRSL